MVFQLCSCSLFCLFIDK